MSLTYIRPRSIKAETGGKLFLVSLFLALLLFFVDTMDAQPIGPQASRLIGTIQSEHFIGAVFSDPKGEQTFYRIFDALPDGSQIVAVRSDSISLKGTDGMSYDMYIAHDMIKSPVANIAAPAQPDVPVDPFTPGAIRKPAAQQPLSSYEQRHGRRDKSSSDVE